MIEPIISLYKADISDHKAKIKELSGEQKKLAQEQLGHLEAQNKKLDGHIQTIGKVGIALGAAAVAGKLLWEGWEYSARKAQLSTNVFSGDVDKLRKGFGGLRTEMESLEVANKLSQSTYKLTGTQIETVGRAIRQLVREGATWDNATQKVTESIVKLEGDALKDFGIRLREAKTDGERFAAIMDGLAEKSGKLGNTAHTSAEQLAGMKTRFGDAMDGIKVGLGEIAKAFAPVIEQLASVVGYVGRIASALGEGGTLGKIGTVLGWINPLSQGRKALGYIGGKLADYGSDDAYRQAAPWEPVRVPSALRFDPNAGMSVRDPNARPMYLGPNFDAFGQGAAGVLGAGAKAKTAEQLAAAKRAMDEYNRIWGKAVLDIIEGAAPRAGLDDHEVGAWSFDDSPASFGALGSQPSIDLRALGKYGPGGADDARAYGQYNADKAQSKLAAMFGPLEDFDAYGAAFQGLTSIVQSSFDAWITGSMGVGEAIKQMAGEVLRANAVELMGQAIKHGVYALGSLAFGDMRGAAQHGATAGKALAGAAALGALARGLGAGGASGAGAGAGAGAAPTGSAATGDAGGGGNTYVISYGDSFADDSPLNRQRNAQKMIDSVMGAPGVH